MSWLDPKTGEKSAPRRSPKKGTRYDCVRELYALRDYLLRDGFRLCLVFLELEEVRLKNGWGNGGKRGSERMDRLPLGFCDIEFYNEPADYGLFLPDALPPEFTAAEFASAAHVTPMIAGMTVNLLLRTGHIAPGGKRGRALLYRKI